MNSRFSFSDRKDGSAFITVILFTFLLTTLIASVIGWSRNERLLTVRHAHWLEARSAAEAVAEYAFAQIEDDFNGHSIAPTFDPGQGTTTSNYPVSVPPSAFWDSNGHVDMTTSGTTSLFVLAGPPTTIPASGGFYYVDSNVPNNASDPLKTDYIQRHDVSVLARASVKSPEGGPPITTYVIETISVRGAPLFANAIFYSDVDLEIFPGPTMVINGPVRCNGNMFVSSQGSSLTFNGPVSMSGNLYHAWSNSAKASQGTGSETLDSNSVLFLTSAGTTKPLLQSVGTLNGTSYGSTWVDSTMGTDSSTSGLSNLQALVSAQITTDFREEATQVWGGNLQTAAMGVQVNNPISFSQVIDSAGDTPNPHSIIDPPEPSSYINADSNYAAARLSVEQQKFSTQSGLYVLVSISATSNSAPTATINLYGPGPDNPEVAQVSVEGDTTSTHLGPNGGPLLASYSTQTSNGQVSTANGMIKFIPYISQTTGSATVVSTTYTLNGLSFNKNVTTAQYPASRTNWSTGSGTAAPTGSATSSSTSTTSVATAGSATTTTAVTMGSATNSSTNTVITSGMYDQRRGMGIDEVQIDMGVLTAAIKDMITGTNADSNAITYTTLAGTVTHVWGATETLVASSPGSNVSTPWNGGVYIDVEAPNAETSNQSASVVITDAQVTTGSSMVPNYSTSVIGFGANQNGITIATNAPVYVAGNFNSNGTLTASSDSTPDDGKTDNSSTNISAESPACIAADAITLLSPSFNQAGTLTKDPNATGTIEVAAALLTGIQPTTASASSGGAHNLPRFLESFSSSQTVAIRGSLTCLYQSEIATQPWGSTYYGAPPRQWGYDVQFQNGHFPPLVPKVMSYRRVMFTDISAAQFTSYAHSWYPTEY